MISHALNQVRGRFHLRTGLGTERPQLPGRPMELVDHGVDLESVLLAGPEPVHRLADMLNQHTELRLVIRSHQATGSRRSAFVPTQITLPTTDFAPHPHPPGHRPVT